MEKVTLVFSSNALHIHFIHHLKSYSIPYFSFNRVKNAEASPLSSCVFPHQPSQNSKSDIISNTFGVYTLVILKFSINSIGTHSTKYLPPRLIPKTEISVLFLSGNLLSHSRPQRYTFVFPLNAVVPYLKIPFSSIRVFLMFPVTAYLQEFFILLTSCMYFFK